MLNKKTQQVLKSLLGVNNSMIVSKDMTVVDEFKTLLGKVNLGLLEDDIKEFGLYDAGGFLNAVSLLDDPTIELEKNLLKIKDQNTSIEYVITDLSALEDCVVDPEIIETTQNTSSVLDFELTQEVLDKIKKASSVFKTSDALYIISSGGKTTLKVATKESFVSSRNSFSISIDASSEKDFELPIPLENIMKIPSVGYTVSLKYNQERDAYRVVLSNEIYTFVFTLLD